MLKKTNEVERIMRDHPRNRPVIIDVNGKKYVRADYEE